MARPRLTTGRYIGCLAGWTVFSTSVVLALNLDPARPVARAVILMGAGLVLLWVIVGGTLMRLQRGRARALIRSLPGGWQVKFVLLCTLLALAEEAITVMMTNCAPLFGVPLGKAYITSSANYLDVVCFHSVVTFVPWFICWAWLLSRLDFHPSAVFLLFGATGTLAEMSFGGPQHLAEYGMWTFVYGLMVYLPAYSVPSGRGARQPKWWHYPAAVFAPFLFMVLLFPFGFVKQYVHGPTDIHFPPIAPGT